MPDKDDKNSGHTSKPGQFERGKDEVAGNKDGHQTSFKSANDREANAPRNHEDDEDTAARSVPASKQG